MIPWMQQTIAWFGWGHGIGAVIGISAILTMFVIVAPVAAGMLLYGLERLQIKLLGSFNYSFALFFVNYVTFPGTFVHEMSHLCLGVISGAEVNEICMFESRCGRLGHIGYRRRGPRYIQALQEALISVAPTVTGFAIAAFLLNKIFSEHFDLWKQIILWYLVVSLIDHATMSDSDLKGYFWGAWSLILPIMVLFTTLGLLA